MSTTNLDLRNKILLASTGSEFLAIFTAFSTDPTISSEKISVARDAIRRSVRGFSNYGETQLFRDSVLRPALLKLI